MADKPAILQESRFTLEEGWAYRAFRTGAIWMNKLFFSSVFLLAVWLSIAAVRGDTACVPSVDVGNTTSDTVADKCTVWLTPTSKYLGAMAVLSFLASLAFGALGLVVGKKVLEATPVAEEVGARREGDDAGQAPASSGDRPPQ
jgi:hypothetical protein